MRAMGSAEELFVVFNPMPNYSTATMEAGGRKRLNRALERIKSVGPAGLENLEGFVIFVMANDTCPHDS